MNPFNPTTMNQSTPTAAMNPTNHTKAMNPSNPSTAEMRMIEALFFEQIKHTTRLTTDPILAARAKLNAAHRNHLRTVVAFGDVASQLRSFDYQCSDRWIGGAL